MVGDHYVLHIALKKKKSFWFLSSLIKKIHIRSFFPQSSPSLTPPFFQLFFTILFAFSCDYLVIRQKQNKANFNFFTPKEEGEPKIRWGIFAKTTGHPNGSGVFFLKIIFIYILVYCILQSIIQSKRKTRQN